MHHRSPLLEFFFKPWEPVLLRRTIDAMEEKSRYHMHSMNQQVTGNLYAIHMKCVIIIGPEAVGKMTVGRAIAEKTGYKLLHNHMTIDFILNFFEFKSTSFQRLDSLFRFSLMKEVADSDLPGFIFTFIWGFNRSDNWEYIQKIEDIFSAKGHEVVFLELE